MCCSLTGVVHAQAGDLEFLGNLYGIDFFPQNKSRPMSFRRNFSFSGDFENIIEATNADTPDTQLVSATFRYFFHNKPGLASTDTTDGAMVAENGPHVTYVDFTLSQMCTHEMHIYHINNVNTVCFNWKKNLMDIF